MHRTGEGPIVAEISPFFTAVSNAYEAYEHEAYGTKEN